MSLNLSSARSYNKDRHYSVHAIWVMQRLMGMSSTSGSFDNDTIRTIYDWQGSPDRLTSLKQDGKFGPNSLGCMLAEMRRGPMSTDIAHLNPYPHSKPSGSGPGASAIISSFLITDLQNVDLRADGAGWQMRGRFRVDVRLRSSLADPGRYQYRQYIKGSAKSIPGRFTTLLPSTASWVATGAEQDHASAFGVPGGLSSGAWREDGVSGASGTRRYGYRRDTAFVGTGEEDRYLSRQSDGRHYICVDTFGIMGSRRVFGTKLKLKLHYKGVIIDTLTSNREVDSRTWSYDEERIIT